MHRIARTTFQPNTLRKVIVIVGLANICLASVQSCAANDTNGQAACATVLRPLVIQVEFPDISRNISSKAVKEKYLDELDEYIRDVSHNRVCIEGKVTEKWYKLPKPISDYWVPWQNQRANKSNLRNLVSDSLDAVDQDIDVSTYDFVIVALAATFDEWGNNGVAAYPGMLGWKSDEILFTRSGRKVNRGIVVYASTVHLGHVFHDVAHVLGGVKDGKRVLPCLYDQDLQGKSTLRTGSGVFQAFTDSQIHMGGWDTMSCNNCLQRPAPPGISSWTKLRLGWLEPAKIRVVNPGEKVEVTLGPLEDASSQFMVIKIPVTDTTYYLIENRQYIGHDKYLPETGVLIMFADDTIGESRHGQGMVKLINANPGVPRLESAAFDIDKNASFTDDQNGVRVKLLKKSGKSYDILVEYTPR
ncbi:MAG: hypothetical protein HY080_06160 [Gammaproteobacteria bacterium]|nr:hypothetical protein [Gammaproteobacteria bacterium]